jgi:serine/threonine-protein kinase
MASETRGSRAESSMPDGARAPTRVSPLAPPEEAWRLSLGAIVGKYEIVRRIGRGGMGQVFEGRHSEIGTSVAIKVCTESDADSAARFMREARAMGRLRSAHTVRVLDVGRLPSGEAFMVMELLVGTDLASLQNEQPKLPWRTVVGYMLDVAEALTEAHDAGIVHRDLKPQNLFLTKTSRGEPCVRVLDFGLAKGEASAEIGTLTQSNELVGTPAFMAPEQFKDGRCADKSIDMWAIGICMYRLASGEYPFVGTTFGGVAAEILRSEPRPLRELRPDIPDSFGAIVSRCLQKAPELRFPNMRALADALERAKTEEGLAVTMPGGPPPEALIVDAPRSPRPPATRVGPPPVRAALSAPTDVQVVVHPPAGDATSGPVSLQPRSQITETRSSRLYLLAIALGATLAIFASAGWLLRGRYARTAEASPPPPAATTREPAAAPPVASEAASASTPVASSTATSRVTPPISPRKGEPRSGPAHKTSPAGSARPDIYESY